MFYRSKKIPDTNMKSNKHLASGVNTVKPRSSGPRLPGFLDYPDFFSSPNLVMNIY